MCPQSYHPHHTKFRGGEGGPLSWLSQPFLITLSRVHMVILWGLSGASWSWDRALESSICAAGERQKQFSSLLPCSGLAAVPKAEPSPRPARVQHLGEVCSRPNPTSLAAVEGNCFSPQPCAAGCGSLQVHSITSWWNNPEAQAAWSSAVSFVRQPPNRKDTSVSLPHVGTAGAILLEEYVSVPLLKNPGTL